MAAASGLRYWSWLPAPSWPRVTELGGYRSGIGTAPRECTQLSQLVKGVVLGACFSQWKNDPMIPERMPRWLSSWGVVMELPDQGLIRPNKIGGALAWAGAADNAVEPTRAPAARVARRERRRM